MDIDALTDVGCSIEEINVVGVLVKNAVDRKARVTIAEVASEIGSSAGEVVDLLCRLENKDVISNVGSCTYKIKHGFMACDYEIDEDFDENFD